MTPQPGEAHRCVARGDRHRCVDDEHGGLVAAARPVDRGDPVWCRRAVVAHLPLIRKLSHREQLVFEVAQILGSDRVMSANTPCRWAPGSDPAAHRLGVPTDLFGGFGDSQHRYMVGATADPSLRLGHVRPERRPPSCVRTHGRSPPRERLQAQAVRVLMSAM